MNVPAEHVEHFIASDGEEGGAHALDIGGVDAAEADKELRLAHHLVGPFLLVEVGPEGVGDRVRGDLVAVSVEILHLNIREDRQAGGKHQRGSSGCR